MANTKFIFIVYDSTISPPSSSANGEIQGNGDLSDLVSMVAKILAQNGCRVATLVGKFFYIVYIVACVLSREHKHITIKLYWVATFAEVLCI